ncbi:MAG: PEP-CTERM exosortase interaction domain protein [Halothiobacillaceae bacterium]|nr:MAG: PEP-CTERM exosortase interaction domain protein [Halothiobacillaceae bacterium]
MKSLKTLTVAALFAVSGSAFAVPITGTINITGTNQLLDGMGSPSTVAASKKIDFIGPGTVVAPSDSDFAGALGGTATMTDFTFDVFAGSVTPLWSVTVGPTTWSFDLTALQFSKFTVASNDFLVISGKGIAHMTGKDDTNAEWSYSTQNGTLSVKSTSYSSTTVPAPGLLALVGLGLVGMGVARRFKKA